MKGIFQVAKRVVAGFDTKQRWQFLCLMGMIVISAIFELICVPAVLPLINLAMEPEAMQQSWLLKNVGEILGFQKFGQYLIFSLVLIILVYLIKSIVTIILYRVQYRFIYRNQQSLAARLMKCYIYQPYLFHTSHNVSDLQRDVSTDVINYYTLVLTLVQMLTELVVCSSIAIYLFWADPIVTCSVVLMLGALLGSFLLLYKKKLSTLGEYCRKGVAQTNKWLLQAFGGIKEIKVSGKERYFIDRYNDANKKYTGTLEQQQLLTNVPKPIIEATAITVLLASLLIRMLMTGQTDGVVQTLSVFAVAAFRLLPSFNRMSGYITTFTYYKASAVAVHNNLLLEKRMEYEENSEKQSDLHMNEVLEVRNMTFQYPDSGAAVLNTINLKIKKNQTVAFIGPSGAGKSTLADLILGILRPQQGGIYVDGIDIRNNIEQWHHKIGYIPQTIYLLDDTIRANVAFGVSAQEVDEQKVWESLREAQLDDFVKSLEKELDTEIGERGVRLSGGQRQRLGIARALYQNPEVLLLDEATSALDHETENAVMYAIDSMQGSKTMIIIAHRLTTIQNCDKVYRVENHQVTECKKGVVLGGKV